MIKHLSFDLWMTLIRSNPNFRTRRAELIIEKFNPENTSIEGIIQTIVEVDKVFDRQNETENTKIPAHTMYAAILEQLHVSTPASLHHDANCLLNASNELFLKHPPTFLNNHIPNILHSLKNEGYTLSIGSNTGFIEAPVLRVLLQQMDILPLFSFLIFSDEIKMSKPSAGFFSRIQEQTTLHPSEILHVGDNPTNDYRGALNFGFNALLLTHSNYTFNDICAKLK